jgi:phosphoribosylglycinamide synthetase, ATP-grasp (A) domain
MWHGYFYTPVPYLPKSVLGIVVDTISKSVLEVMIKKGHPYLVVLYASLILKADVPKAIEFNARFYLYDKVEAKHNCKMGYVPLFSDELENVEEFGKGIVFSNERIGRCYK